MQAKEISPLLSTLDDQQVEEQLKVAERRFVDVERRLNRKLHLLQTTQHGSDSAHVDVSQMTQWIQEKAKQIRDKEPLALRAKAAESRFLVVKGLCKEVESQLLLIQNLEQRIVSISTDLDPEEQSQLDAEIKNLNGEADPLITAIISFECLKHLYSM